MDEDVVRASGGEGSVHLSRRGVLRGAGGVLGLLVAGPTLAACGSGPSSQIRFESYKPETVTYFDQLTADFNSSQRTVQASHDSTSNLVAGFVRGDPPDLDCDNFDLASALFITRGVLSDLADLEEADRVRDEIKDLATQYGSYRGETSVLPFSVAAAGVTYNADLFDRYQVAVPTTWTEVIAACETFKSHDVTPIYATYSDSWTVQQGLFDYVAGGLVDSAAFFARLNAAGATTGTDDDLSFTQTFAPAARKMMQLRAYVNADAGSRSYEDGNAAFAAGKAAMYFQGPWAFGEIAKLSPSFPVRTFALPVTDDPADTKVRVNLDLACWIPRSTQKTQAARTMLAYLFRPDVINAYNQTNLASSPLKGAPANADPRLAGLQPYVSAGRIYQGAGTYIPLTIPSRNYIQDMFQTGDWQTNLRRLDEDWARLAARTSA